MKHVKMPGLVVVAAMATMAFVSAGTASADEHCTNATGSECVKVTTIDLSIVGGTFSINDTEEEEEINTCTGSTVEASVSTQGAGSHIAGSVAKADLTW